MRFRALGLLALLGLPVGAAAQSITSGSVMTFALSWQDTENRNGVLEPGESALLSLDVSFTNQNTVATFTPGVGTFGSGTIRGLGSGFIELHGTGGAQGTWVVDPALGYGIAHEWDITGGKGNGIPNSGGANLAILQFGQFPPDPSAIITTNPVQSVWRGVWTPSSYAQRTVTFSTSPSVSEGPPGSLVFQLSPTTLAGIFVRSTNYNFDSAQIPIVPRAGLVGARCSGGLAATPRVEIDAMRHRMLGVLPVVGLAVSAAAQPFTSDSSVTFSLRWSEHGGNQNGLLEPGESAFLSLDVSFTNQNQIAQFAPHVGTFGSGTIRGFGAGFLDYHGTATNGGNARGAWNVDEAMGYGVSVNWGTGLIESGIPVNGGADLINIQFGQFAASPSAIMTMNPVVAIWTGLWTPESYTPRTVTFTPAGAAISGWAAGIVLRLSTSAVATVFVPLDHCIFDGVSIPIVPTPPSLAGIVPALLLRRRRPGSVP